MNWCKNTPFDFHGFTVQPGMVYGTHNDLPIVTTGRVDKHGRMAFYTLRRGAIEWTRHLTLDPSLKARVAKYTRNRDNRGVSVSYATPLQVEASLNPHKPRTTVPHRASNGKSKYIYIPYAGRGPKTTVPVDPAVTRMLSR